MRLSVLLPIAVTLLSYCTGSVAAGVPRLAVRQEADGTTTTSSTSAPSTTTDTPSTSPAASTQSDESISTTARSTRTTSTAAEASTATTGKAAKATASGGAKSDDDEELPLPPTLTPAVGLAGAVLILTGVGYTLIGIKNEWLYISLSTAYLTCISILVLIIYVMKPPVSDAIQGAYFVGIFLPACILGGVSIIFREVTDKLACLLGGFCLSMWFLTLKEGGLITSTTGKIIFIGCMCFGGSCLAFSRYTKEHGLIVCISFGGATATVLGIDCFSRAGMKEFWIYLWDLNDREFPLYTTTYPITRGIRVELAATIILFLIGIMSQYKIWRIIKDRREKKAQALRERDDDLDKIETAVGQRIENDNERTLGQWEATFGKGTSGSTTARDSLTDTAPKQSVSILELRRSLSDTIEMDELETPKEKGKAELSQHKPDHSGRPAPVQIQVVEDEQMHHAIAEDSPTEAPSEPSRIDSVQRQPSTSGAGKSADGRLSVEALSTPTPSRHTSVRISVPPPPEVVPPPFVVPTTDETASDDGSNASTMNASMTGQRNSARFSRGSGMKRLSAARSSMAMTESQEALIIPHIEDDRASSLAATMDEREDDDESLPAISPPPSPSIRKLSIDGEGEPRDADILSRLARESADPEKFPMLTVSTNPKAPLAEVRAGSENGEKEAVHDAAEGQHPPTEGKQGISHSKSTKSRRTSGESRPSTVAPLTGQLPDGLSKVAMTYRTNEWAKHLELAEKPELDTLQENVASGIAVDHSVQEAPAPVIIEQPRHSASTRPASQSNNPYHQSDPRRSESRGTKKHSPPRSTSQLNFGGSLAGAPSRNSSQSRLSTRAGRSPSIPYNTHANPSGTLDEVAEADDPHRPLPTVYPSDTLMGQRSSRMLTKPMPTSFNASSSNLPPVDPSDPAASARPSLTPSPMEDMSLAERKHHIQALQQQQQYPPAAPAAAARSRPSSQQHHGINFDSHQPRRDKGMDHGRRENMLAAWRESVRNEVPASAATTTPAASRPASQQQYATAVPPVVADRHRHQLQAQQQQQQQQQQAAAAQRQSARESMMRGPDMLNAHAAAMKRLQASANKKTSGAAK